MKCPIIDSCFNCYTSEMKMCNSSQFKKCSVYLKEILEGKNMNQSTNEECKHIPTYRIVTYKINKLFCRLCDKLIEDKEPKDSESFIYNMKKVIDKHNKLIEEPKDSEEEYIYCTKQDYINENKKFIGIIKLGLELLEKEEFGQLSHSGSFYKDMKKILEKKSDV